MQDYTPLLVAPVLTSGAAATASSSWEAPARSPVVTDHGPDSATFTCLCKDAQTMWHWQNPAVGYDDASRCALRYRWHHLG